MTKWLELLTIACSAFIFSFLGISQVSAAPESEWSHFYKDGEHALFIGDYKTAEEAFGLALEVLKKLGDHSVRLKFTLEKLTKSFLLDNNLKSAELNYSQLRELIHTGDRSTKLEQMLLIDLKELAHDYERKWRRYHDQACLEHSHELNEVASAGDVAKLTEEMVMLSRLYIRQGQLDKGIDQLKRAIAVSEKTFGKSPNILSETLLQQAIECQGEGNYKVANEIAMRLIKMANADRSSLRVGLPTFYVCLGANTMAQGETSKSKAYFANAIQEASNIRKKHNKGYEKLLIQSYAEPMRRSIAASSDGADSAPKRAVLEMELKQLAAVSQVATSAPGFLSATLNVLSDVLYAEGKSSEADKCEEHAIALAKHENADEDQRKEIPGMYLKMANHRAQEHEMGKANDAFASAIKEEKDKNGSHKARVLFWWASQLKANGQSAMAIAKLDAALKIARSLPTEKRGTILADALMLRLSFNDPYAKSQTKSLAEELSKEICNAPR